jgi:hypothetical protein
VTFVSKYFRLQPDTVLSYLTRKGLAYRAMDAEKVPYRAGAAPCDVRTPVRSFCVSALAARRTRTRSTTCTR